MIIPTNNMRDIHIHIIDNHYEIVCRRTIRQHNGDLLAQSSLSDGSTFAVVLPPASRSEAREEADDK